jgi:hypothetical protein
MCHAICPNIFPGDCFLIDVLSLLKSNSISIEDFETFSLSLLFLVSMLSHVLAMAFSQLLDEKFWHCAKDLELNLALTHEEK